ncbi:alginate export family protein [Pseudomonas agarici]|uniref:alginate export family protein n=1 Tax=Pseudomonas agarici TaxID=46677 RepID=UPI000319241A|nr:alginate export family protein [Pseudomonas agarici]NWC09298.1 alginate export family protein [Pseudomonas agarici]SEK29072.1 Alginate export [Pseudomonas agarici]
MIHPSLNRYSIPLSIVMVLSHTYISSAQATEPQAAALSPLESQRPPRSGPTRSQEDYRFLDDPAKRTDPFDGLRYQRLSDTAWLQTGAELRYRADAADKPVFGLRGVKDDSYLMQRAQIHADLHLFDDSLRTFIQLENTRVFGKDLPSPSDQSRNEIHQAFIDGNLHYQSGKLTTRVGRQEMAYGNNVLVTYREIPNMRLSFDGVRMSWAGKNGYKLDAFSMKPLLVRPSGSFNDSSNHQQKFYGLYGTVPLSSVFKADLYAFGLETDQRKLDGFTGKEDRYTFGTRLFGAWNKFDWTWDLMKQTGHIANADIDAWGVSSDSGYTFAGPWKARLGFRFDAASGDKDGDHKAGSFDPMFPKNAFYGQASLTTLSNIILTGPTLRFSPFDKVRFEPGVFAAWRQNTDDGVYLPGMVAVPGTTTSKGKRLGTLYQTNVNWTPTSNITVDLDYLFYDIGSAIKNAGGSNSQIVVLRTSFRY